MKRLHGPHLRLDRVPNMDAWTVSIVRPFIAKGPGWRDPKPLIPLCKIDGRYVFKHRRHLRIRLLQWLDRRGERNLSVAEDAFRKVWS